LGPYYLALQKEKGLKGGFKSILFQMDGKNLEMSGSDLVYGMDWLEQFRPMVCD
jgi:hypothetical protein